MKKSLFFAVCLLAIQVSRADVKLPTIFNDNMVLQQQSEVAIWGWAKPNATVKIAASWSKKNYSVKVNADGKWRVKIQTPAADFTPYTLSVSEGNTITLKNILLGEVWVCSGQSNMEMPMQGFRGQPITGGPEDIRSSRNPHIRMFTVKRSSELLPQEDCVGSWLLAAPETTGSFSATAYYFGRMLFQNLNVPIGLIHTSWGGSRIEAWMTPESLKDIPQKKIPQSKEEITLVNGTPTVLYNGMLHPIQGYGIRGVIWYQGESNVNEPNLYPQLFKNMVTGWRQAWGVGEFPFYYCQIAPYAYSPSVNSYLLREAQIKGMTDVANTGMAVLMDADSPDCIHPPKKKDAGERLALWALAQTYGAKGLSYKSPAVKNVEITGRMITITFDCADSPGLTSYGKEIKNCKIAGENKYFRPAVASIFGNKMFVFSPQIENPVAVRYCFDNTSASEIFLVDSNLPLSSFRTDDL